MKTTFTTLRAIAPAFVAVAALIMAGCSESATQKDVAKAQKNLEQAREKTKEAAHEAQNDVANAQQDARGHIVAKPVTPEQATDAQQNVAEAQHDAAQDIAAAKENEHAAVADLKDTQQKFQATQEREAFVQQAETKLADYDKRIDDLKQQASTAEGANTDAINRQIDTVKNQRDLANKALGDLKGADLATWKNHEDHVRMAFQDLDNSMRNVR
jgi:DNA repair exonuclease SbcCD ATPase subunit